MPRLDPSLIVISVIDALDAGGTSTILTSNVRGNPRHFVVQTERRVFDLWVYVWTLTHGGGAARPRNEYRIQITGITPPLALNPNGLTVLIGYEPNTGCFAGFDLSKHRTFSTRSPSIQIPITALHDALQHGFSFVTKGNDEIAIGIRPDQFWACCLNADVLHREGADANMVGLLSRAATLIDISEQELGDVSTERQRIVTEILRLSRDSSFRQRVIVAYDRRCAVTRMQLRLIDAAHILPVGVEGSSDSVTNGICLSPTYHRAMDRVLIYLDDDFVMRINPAKEKELIAAGLDGGLADFKSYLGTRIHLPADPAYWPDSRYVRAANAYRGITDG